MLDLSCRRRGDAYFVVTDRWQRFSELAVDEASLAALADSCDEFLVRLPLREPGACLRAWNLHCNRKCYAWADPGREAGGKS